MKIENPFDYLNHRLDQIYNKLDEMQQTRQKKKDDPDPNEILNVKQAAELLNLSIYSIYAKTSRKEIPFSKRGRHLYFFKADLINWLKTGKYKTNDEIEMEALEHLFKKS
ncbi:helix-turn-helix domain-containing protein [Lunatibacter salilacus]|uniref:helix-turn-helix domain-containing protein n=1 Tax=Lunatibacter salilacus TaxID=2483804 RepID=UPI00131E51F2|nr:helix-turn-helix domain-containing protein [Lunatibacter salilacus]